jgi:hypothetical protein
MHRLVIFALAVVLAGIGQVPLSASALFSSPVECPFSKVHLDCNDMNMAASAPELSAREDSSCCVVTGLPTQDLQFVVAASPSVAAPLATHIAFGDAPQVWTAPPEIPWHNFSPPASLSRLCTFLI